MPDEDWKFWEQETFIKRLPSLPHAISASRALPRGADSFVPVSLAALFVVICTTPLWRAFAGMFPATSYLHDAAEFAPVLFIAFCGVAAEFVADRKLEWIKRTATLRITETGLELSELGKKKQLAWKDVNKIHWDNEAGKNHQHYLVTEVSTPATTIRISEQFFQNHEVVMLYGLAMIKTGGRTLRMCK